MVRQRSERGAAAVEFALILPVLIALLLGITEFGRAYFVLTTISGAARQGARVMALQNSVSAAQSAVTSAVGAVPVDQVAVSPASCPSVTTNPAATVTVKVTSTMTFISSYFGPSITLTGTGVMRCNG